MNKDKTISVRLDNDLAMAVITKNVDYGMISISDLIRQLLVLYVEGEIDGILSDK